MKLLGSIQRDGLNNRLIRWVHRHNRMATLFRSPLPGQPRTLWSESPDPYHPTVQSWSPSPSPEGVKFESQSVSPRIDNQEKMKPRQISSPEKESSLKNAAHLPQPPSSRSSTFQEESQDQDQDWKRLQAIFRMHQGQAGAEPSESFEGAQTNTESLAGQTTYDPSAEDPQLKRKPAEQQVLQSSSDQHQTRTERTSDNVFATRGSQIDIFTPKNLPSPYDDQAGRQSNQTIHRKHQEYAKPRSITTPEKKTGRGETATPDLPPIPQKKERQSLQQRISHGLKAIFRKRLEPEDVKIPARIEDPTKSATEPAESDLLKSSSTTNKIVQPTNETTETNEQAMPIEPLPVSRSTTAVLSTQPMSGSVQTRAIPSISPAPKMPRQSEANISQADHSLPSEAAEAHSTSFNELLSEELYELPDEATATDQVQLQTIPLQSAWNVQSIDTDEPLTREPIAPSKLNPLPYDETTHFDKFDQDMQPEVDMKSITVDHEPPSMPEENSVSAMDELLSASSRTPVEILTPNRPRPTRASVMQSNSTVQRQPENSNFVREEGVPPMIDTAIGPLPSDLWTLLGQKPPASVPPTEAHNHVFSGPHLEESSQPAQALSLQQSSKLEEKPVHEVQLPDAIQRASASADLSTSSSPEQAQTTQGEKSSIVESDLNDLAHKVYIEVRRRMAMEWERIRR